MSTREENQKRFSVSAEEFQLVQQMKALNQVPVSQEQYKIIADLEENEVWLNQQAIEQLGHLSGFGVDHVADLISYLLGVLAFNAKETQVSFEGESINIVLTLQSFLYQWAGAVSDEMHSRHVESLLTAEAEEA